MSFEKFKRRLANLQTSSKSNKGNREPSAVKVQQRILEATSDPIIWAKVYNQSFDAQQTMLKAAETAAQTLRNNPQDFEDLEKK
jgi:hypothetical protein